MLKNISQKLTVFWAKILKIISLKRQSTFNWKNPKIILFFILFLGFLFRFIAILNRGTFRFDEIASIWLAKNPFPYLFYENTPPLFTFILSFWGKFFSFNEISSRILPLLFGLASIYLIYQLAKKIFHLSQKSALFVSFLVSISTYQIFPSTEVRTYSLLFFLSLFSVYSFFALIEKENKKNWLIFLLINSLLVYTHLTALALVLAENIFFFIKKSKNLRITTQKWLIGQGFIFILFCFWLVPFLIDKIGEPIYKGWYFLNPIPSFYFLESLKSFLILYSGNSFPLIEMLLIFILFILLFFSFFEIQKLKNPFQLKFLFDDKKIFLLIWLFLPLILSFIFKIFYPRFFIVASGALYLLMAQGLENLFVFLRINFKNLKFSAYLLIYTYFLLIFLFLPFNLMILLSKNNWDKVGNYIEAKERPGDKVILHFFCLSWPFNYYYKGNLPVEGFYPLEDKENLETRIIKRNWQMIVNENNIEKLSQSTANYQRIFLIQQNLTPLALIWFQKNNWKLIEEKNFSGIVESPIIFTFEKN